jgi:hypothetical protein
MAVETTANLRLLKAVVIILGVAILAAIGVIIVTIVERAGNLAADPDPGPVSATGRSAPAAFGERHLAVPDGDRVVAMTADGDRLVLRLERPDGGTYLLVVDLRTGARLGTIRLGPE